MGKKRKFNRFIRWIKSDLPEDNKSVLLLGVTKIPSPTPVRARPHTLHLDHHLAAAKSQTLDSQPRPRSQLFRSHSGDSLNELLTARIKHLDVQKQPTVVSKFANCRFIKKVSFDTDKNKSTTGCFDKGLNSNKSLGFCTEQPFEFYHPKNNNNTRKKSADEYSNKTNFVMDKSVDSIGSCSLDVDVSSTDFSDSSIGSSDCTLRSLGVPTPTTQPSTLLPTFRIDQQPLEIPEAKKPSYLNLACTVNGYSNITNYDSKHRDNFRLPRSREVSPIRPQDYHAIRQEPSGNFLTPYQKMSALSPAENILSTNMSSESKTQSILRSSTSYSSYSSSSATTKNVSYMNESRKMMFASDNKDTVDHSPFKTSNGISSPNSKYSSHHFENNKMMNGKYTHLSETCHESFLNGQSNGKSFIQQRVERLYGPGALAQGFFISKQNRNRSHTESSESRDTSLNQSNNSFNNSTCVEIENKENDQANFKQSPSLPVLRHLRPEFRAQLPILSPKKTSTDATIQKSTTVPSFASQNGDIIKPKLNGTVTSKSVDFPVILENKENISKKLESTVNGKIIPEEVPAALQVILPLETTVTSAVNGDAINNKVNGVDGGAKPKLILNGTSTVSAQEEIKDGYYFLKILKNETDRLIGMAEVVEIELEKMMNDFTDDVLGYLRSASGKARLLVTQKMQQFEGLCHKNINQIEGEPFPTTVEDLQGFWDMVMLQVTQIDQLFAELDQLRSNNWILEEKPTAVVDPAKTKKLMVKKTVSANTEAQRKQREAARKKMIEERRRAMRENQTLVNERQQSIEIFVPELS